MELLMPADIQKSHQNNQLCDIIAAVERFNHSAPCLQMSCGRVISGAENTIRSKTAAGYVYTKHGLNKQSKELIRPLAQRLIKLRDAESYLAMRKVAST